MSPSIFIINVVVVILFFVSTCTSQNATSKKITISSRMALGMCSQRDEYFKSKKLVPAVKKLPSSTAALTCGWFRLQKCPYCDVKFKTCAEVAAGAPTVTESPVPAATGTGTGTENPIGTATVTHIGTGTGTVTHIGTGTGSVPGTATVKGIEVTTENPVGVTTPIGATTNAAGTTIVSTGKR